MIRSAPASAGSLTRSGSAATSTTVPTVKICTPSYTNLINSFHRMRLHPLFQTHRSLQWKTLRRWTYQKRIVTRQQLPTVLIHIKDGEKQWLDLNDYIFAFARIKSDLAPAHQPLGRFAGTRRQGSIDLRDFYARAVAGVLHCEAHASRLARRHL